MLLNPFIYPADASFIEVLDATQRDRLVRLGFNEPNAICFEVPYCPISGFGAGILRDYARRCYYKFLMCTRGVVQSLEDDVLHVVIEHERHEIRDAVLGACEANQGSGLTTLEAEQARHVPEFEELAARHGHEVTNRAITETRQIASAFPTVPRHIVLFWLTLHVVTEHARYSSLAVPMPESMQSKEQRRRQMEMLQKVMTEYGGRLSSSAWANLFGAAASSAKSKD